MLVQPVGSHQPPEVVVLEVKLVVEVEQQEQILQQTLGLDFGLRHHHPLLPHHPLQLRGQKWGSEQDGFGF